MTDVWPSLPTDLRAITSESGYPFVAASSGAAIALSRVTNIRQHD